VNIPSGEGRILPLGPTTKEVGSLRILIADDDQGFRVFIRRVLELEKDWVIVGEAVDGGDAVSKAEQLRPNLVLMDMDLPGIDGLEATRQIKAAIPGTVVIMFSSLDGPAYRDAAARCGANEFLFKLDPLSKIITTIRGSS
jgi:DNA-binding NarL/FixJ family response regulator